MMDKKRFLFDTLLANVSRKEIILLVGARQTGKTTLLQQLYQEMLSRGESCTFLTLEVKRYLDILNQDPENIFQLIAPLRTEKRNVVFIDEVQYLNDPSNFLKHLFDLYHEQIKLIVSGSSAFYIDRKFRDSLAGRKRMFVLPTMSFKEFLYFKNQEELVEYVHVSTCPIVFRSRLRMLLAEYIIYGGYPDVVLAPTLDDKMAVLEEIAQSYVKKDALEAAIRKPKAYLNILKILARQIGRLVNTYAIGKTLRLDNETVDSYMRLMQQSFHIALVSPFYRNVKKELRQKKKVYFQDLGLRNYFANNFDPILLRDDRGELLENYVFRLFADHYDVDWDIRYWRTQGKQEIDFIIKEKQAYEVKFSQSSFKLKKYEYFRSKYPDITLKVIHYDNLLEFSPDEKI
ncbi:MAG: ATP-binding protein [Thermodesulfobacteriota bacterium]